MNKSPFILIESVLDKEACNDIITSLKFFETEKYKIELVNKFEEIKLQGLVDELLDKMEEYYEFYVSSVKYNFTWIREGYKSEIKNIKDSLKYKSNMDFTMYIFLTNSVEKIYDRNMEHIGGDLHFYAHRFKLSPHQGDILIFPSCNNFFHTISDIPLGNMFYVKVDIKATKKFTYDMKKFPGTYKTWFT